MGSYAKENKETQRPLGTRLKDLGSYLFVKCSCSAREYG